MSRARPIYGLWFDKKQNHAKATVGQLEALADAEDVPLDDLLDEGLIQAEVLHRLRLAEGHIPPPEILRKRQEARKKAESRSVCRICDTLGWTCEGPITKHHFVPRWMMLLLDNYQAYSVRAKCTIPVCVGRHRDLHLRGDTQTPKDIVVFLNNEERSFAQKMLNELREQHPKVFDLIAGGDESTYEYYLIEDYLKGYFSQKT